ncbi:cell division protein FtsK [Burkholderia ubonensis]|uniref:DNA translocase FtsK n=1 Tax=Burkholderia ubonensis TaxID=101571 RepID=UPI0007538E01|nr:DNA translocase FtsK [Burkholderia ubonensis]KUZ98123.1 cell division protein FtsK [Burkholderia ubonensis]
MTENNDAKGVLNMTAGTIGRDLLSAVVQEVRLLPDVWVKLSEKKQNDVIDRLRKRVDNLVKMAVHLIASDGRIVVQGDLDQITIKDGVKAVVKFSGAAPNLHELYEASGKTVLVVVANPAEHTEGMDEVRGESDQRGLDLGREYTDADGDGMGEQRAPGDGDGDVVDAEFREVPKLGDGPTQAQLDEQHEAGRRAAEEGQPESECPIMGGELCIAWVKGWKSWHDEQSADDPLIEEVEKFVIAKQRVSVSLIQRHFRIGHNRAEQLVEALEARGVISAPDDKGQRTVLKSAGTEGDAA